MNLDKDIEKDLTRFSIGVLFSIDSLYVFTIDRIGWSDSTTKALIFYGPIVLIATNLILAACIRRCRDRYKIRLIAIIFAIVFGSLKIYFDALPHGGDGFFASERNGFHSAIAYMWWVIALIPIGLYVKYLNEGG